MMTSREAYEAECQKRIRGEGAATANLWHLWQAACEYQKQKDAEICESHHNNWKWDDYTSGPRECAKAILSQGDE